ncbi:Tyrosine-protein kinase transforming protein SEA [Lamellibrachia satsuma]|nr:Tyrosine-protein kinase transforming protein SEA [Lamellibrachia satsuma]
MSKDMNTIFAFRVDEELTVKIADFGLSCDVYRTNNYRMEDKHQPLPVQWMAIECLTLGVFTSKSDVWSFGVNLWELFTHGCSPYPDVDNFNIKSYVLSGRHMSQPQHAPYDVYALICRCWEDDPDNRPLFEELYEELRDIIDRSTANNHHEYLQLVDL